MDNLYKIQSCILLLSMIRWKLIFITHRRIQMFHGITTSGINPSLWYSNITLPDFPCLNENLTIDVCIIGGGIAGLSIAYKLINQGMSVALLEDGKIGSGESGRTSAHLTSIIDTRYFELERALGLDAAKLIAESHAKAIDEIEHITKTENIDCDFSRVNGYLFLGPNDKLKTLEDELQTLKRMSLTNIELVNNPKVNGIKLNNSLVIANQAEFHPLKYLISLSEKITAKGGTIYEKTHATEIKPGKVIKITTNTNFNIKAKHLIKATNAPIQDKTLIAMKQEANRSYVIAGKVNKNSIEKGLFWDTENPYHFIRTYALNNTHDMVLVGGRDHRTGFADTAKNSFTALKSWATSHVTGFEDVAFAWSGQILEPLDRLAFIGQETAKEKNIYVVSGTSGNGLTYGIIASMLIPDLIANKNNPWQDLYDPKRSFLKKIPAIMANTAKGIKGYYDYLTPGDAPNIKAIKSNHAGIVREKLTKEAIYCDKSGKMHEHTAVCPHMGGILCWNAIEHTWDCPVHGSRFTVYGEVINGPANTNLAALKKDEHNEE